MKKRKLQYYYFDSRFFILVKAINLLRGVKHGLQYKNPSTGAITMS